MNYPQDSNSVYEASLVEPESGSKLSPGCLVGMILGGTFLVMIVGLVGIVIYLSPGIILPPTTISRDDDIAEAKSFLLNAEYSEDDLPVAVESHPDFQRIDAFVSQMATHLDNTANKKIRKLIDHKRHWKEICKRSKVNFYESYLTKSDLEDVRDVIAGPASFDDNSDYEILAINKLSDGYQIKLCYDMGYGLSMPQVWWLSDENRLLLYDWYDTESFLRGSAELAAIVDATHREQLGHDRDVELTEAYFWDEEDLSYEEETRRIKLFLQKSETYGGPKTLLPSNLLINAKRWAFHNEPVEAMRVLDRIKEPEKTPGAYVLRADINLANGFYEKAAAGYRAYVATAGSCPYVETQLIRCARENGDFLAEKELLIEACKTISPNRAAQLCSLIELCDESEIDKLLQRIEVSAHRESVYDVLVRRLKANVFYRDQFEQVLAHVKSELPDSQVAQLAEVHGLATPDTLVDALQWLDRNAPDSENEADLLYDFWSEVPERHVVEVFETSIRKAENLESIMSWSNYEGYLENETLRKLYQLVLAENPESTTVNGYLASLLIAEGEYESAIEKLRIVFRLQTGLESESGHRGSMLRALYHSGESDKAIAWANEHDSAAEL
ncbi:hypothetical protein [Mariniblastus fucicola]|uniref:hypothetical protein n=1 Tax=Mariniblastus fucicola TaxID=980251 RepID=UPI0011DF5F8A|nr:hypothetical protein [Mariniblastus fucicola]